MSTAGKNGQRLGSGKPILLIEDNEDDILSIHQALDRAEIFNPLFVVYDGEHAVEYLAGAGQFEERTQYPIPCLVLLNTDLPQLSGLEVLEWIRHESNPLKSLPVILFATSPRKEELKAALRLKATDYLPKTLSFEQMLDWARNLKSRYLNASAACAGVLALLESI